MKTWAVRWAQQLRALLNYQNAVSHPACQEIKVRFDGSAWPVVQSPFDPIQRLLNWGIPSSLLIQIEDDHGQTPSQFEEVKSRLAPRQQQGSPPETQRRPHLKR
jgi:hypothetical protein